MHGQAIAKRECVRLKALQSRCQKPGERVSKLRSRVHVCVQGLRGSTLGHAALVEMKVSSWYPQTNKRHSPLLSTYRFRRAEQVLLVPIELSDDFSFSAFFYANTLPLACFFLLRTLIVRPYARRRAAEAARRQQAQQAAELAQRRREAEAFVQLMQETYDNCLAAERARGGLVIVNAWYGCLVTSQEDENFPAGMVADVTVAVQCLVKDSRLIIHDSNKSSLPGFYDPAPGSDKSLRVRYEFQRKLHEVTVSSSQPLRLPKQSHLLV